MTRIVSAETWLPDSPSCREGSDRARVMSVMVKKDSISSVDQVRGGRIRRSVRQRGRPKTN